MYTDWKDRVYGKEILSSPLQDRTRKGLQKIMQVVLECNRKRQRKMKAERRLISWRRLKKTCKSVVKTWPGDDCNVLYVKECNRAAMNAKYVEKPTNCCEKNCPIWSKLEGASE